MTQPLIRLSRDHTTEYQLTSEQETNISKFHREYFTIIRRVQSFCTDRKSVFETVLEGINTNVYNDIVSEWSNKLIASEKNIQTLHDIKESHSRLLTEVRTFVKTLPQPNELSFIKRSMLKYSPGLYVSWMGNLYNYSDPLGLIKIIVTKLETLSNVIDQLIENFIPLTTMSNDINQVKSYLISAKTSANESYFVCFSTYDEIMKWGLTP